MTQSAQRKYRKGYHAVTAKSWGSDNVQVGTVQTSHCPILNSQAEIVDKAADWNELMDNDVYLRDKLTDFLSYGLMFVKNVPKRPDQLREIGARLGYMLPSHYGKKGDP